MTQTGKELQASQRTSSVLNYMHSGWRRGQEQCIIVGACDDLGSILSELLLDDAVPVCSKFGGWFTFINDDITKLWSSYGLKTKFRLD